MTRAITVGESMYDPLTRNYKAVLTVLGNVVFTKEIFQEAVREAVVGAAADFAFKLVREHRPELEALFDAETITAIVHDAVRAHLDAVALAAIDRVLTNGGPRHPTPYDDGPRMADIMEIVERRRDEAAL